MSELLTNGQALADRLIAKHGFSATIRGEPTASDPVDGTGGADGASRTVNAIFTKIDFNTFPETAVEAGSKMLLCDGPVSVGEVLVDGSDEWTIVAVSDVEPDNSTHIISKALVRG